MNWSLILLLLLLLAIGAAVLFYLRAKEAAAQPPPAVNDNFRHIVEQANDAVFVVDIVDGRLLQTNPGAARLLAFSEEVLAKKRFFDLVRPADIDRSSQVIADVWENGGLIFSDLPFVTAAGELLPLECSAKVSPFAGRPAIVIYARDIRERQRMEREIQEQANIIDQKNRDITDSINYARKIQESILPTGDELMQVVPEHFVYYRPKDIVSGDFYWGTVVHFTPPGGRAQQLSLIAVVDCTGHGVPGAFMSIIGHTLLNQASVEPTVNSPGEALSFIHTELLKTLKQRDKEEALRDGMDISMCAINWEEGWLDFAGANHPLYLIRNGALELIKGNKQPIGRFVRETQPFTAHRIPLQSGDQFYLFSDGLADQFGGPKGKKFKYLRLQEVLLAHHQQPLAKQQEAVANALTDWMRHELPSGGFPEQTDDMLLLGFRVP